MSSIRNSSINCFATNIKCHICNKLSDSLDSLNKHIASVHSMSHILVGHNTTFEKHDASTVKPAFYCPMVKCKYHIAESSQRISQIFQIAQTTLCEGSCQQRIFLHQMQPKVCHYLDSHLISCGKEFICQKCDSKFQS